MKMQKRVNHRVFDLLSLFSGGGFLDIGFINQGFQIQENVEINTRFIEAYNSGLTTYFKDSKNYYIRSGKVTHNNISTPLDVSSNDVHNHLKKSFKNITGIIGGPPCQDFSNGGKHAGVTGERGRLIFSYLDIIKKVKPTFFFFENVPGLLAKSNKPGFLTLIEAFKKLGYSIWYDILNPLEYGFPQDRPRVVVVAFKNHVVKKLAKFGYTQEHDNEKLKSEDVTDSYVFKWPKITHPSPKNISWPKQWEFGSHLIDKDIALIPQQLRQLTVQEAFIGITENTPNQKDHFTPKSDKFLTVPEGRTSKKSFKRLHRYRYSPTVAYGNNEVHLHPTEGRRLTVREALRLQTVPDEYVLPPTITLTDKFKVISNGVPTGKAELIAAEIRRTLCNYEFVCNSIHN